MFCFPAASQQRIQPARMHSCPSSVLLSADKVAPAAMALSQQPGSIMLTLSKGLSFAQSEHDGARLLAQRHGSWCHFVGAE